MWKPDIAKTTIAINNFCKMLHLSLVLNMPELHRVLIIPQKFLNMPEFVEICVNVPKSA